MTVNLCTEIHAVYFSQWHLSNMKGIVFDFNRTLYDPDANRVVPGVRKMLRMLKKQYRLCLVTTEQEGKRDILSKSKLASFFEHIECVNAKTPDVFLRCSTYMRLKPNEIVVIGDRIRSEIIAGNKAGMVTVWLKKGKFAGKLPSSKLEEPNFVIQGLEKLEAILNGS